MEIIPAVSFRYTKENHMKFCVTDIEKQAIYYIINEQI